MATRLSKYFKLNTRQRQTGMVNLVDFYYKAIHLIWKCIMGYIISEPKEHTHHLLLPHNLMSVQPYIRTVINTIEIQPEFFPFITFRSIKFFPEPVRILPWISTAINVAVFCQTVFPVKFIRNIRDLIIIQPYPGIRIYAIFYQSIQDSSWHFRRIPCFRFVFISRNNFTIILYLD